MKLFNIEIMILTWNIQDKYQQLEMKKFLKFIYLSDKRNLKIRALCCSKIY